MLQAKQLRRQNNRKFKKVTNSERSEGPAVRRTVEKQALRLAQVRVVFAKSQEPKAKSQQLTADG
jgi:hypothetical protein